MSEKIMKISHDKIEPEFAFIKFCGCEFLINPNCLPMFSASRNVRKSLAPFSRRLTASDFL